tara:strand:- start:7050 stop:7232 length:183 start_codon:yes stop_codon:yes gene_type:complete
MDRTVSFQEHYVQVGFYQNIIKNKQKEIKDLNKKNDLLEQENEVLKAKLEVEHSNNLMRL